MNQPLPAPPAHNGVSLQRAKILARLRVGPATKEQLQTEMFVPDPTVRIHELREEGHDIATRWIDRVNPDGSINRVALYVLRGKDDRQPNLFPKA